MASECTCYTDLPRGFDGKSKYDRSYDIVPYRECNRWRLTRLKRRCSETRASQSEKDAYLKRKRDFDVELWTKLPLKLLIVADYNSLMEVWEEANKPMSPTDRALMVGYNTSFALTLTPTSTPALTLTLLSLYFHSSSHAHTHVRSHSNFYIYSIAPILSLPRSLPCTIVVR